MHGLIYCALNKENKKQYIGLTTVPLKYRIATHRASLNHNDCNNHFHNALRKYSIDGFEWIELFQAEDKETLDEAERFFIQHYKTITHGYNKKNGGANGKHCQETKDKLSKSHKGIETWNKGIPRSEKTRRKLREANIGRPSAFKGRHHTKEAKEKMSISHKGKILTEEHKRKIGDSGRGEKNHNYGNPVSEERKRKQSISMMGHVPWNKGKSPSEETRRKISETLKRRGGGINGRF